MNGLSKKIAMITGGSRGLGRNTAIRLAKNGADIVLTYRSQQKEGEAVVAEIEGLGRKAVLLQLDVAEVKQFDRFRDDLAKALQSN